MPASTDPFPRDIEIVPGRRRTVELSLEGGRFVARVPRRVSRRELTPMLARLRAQLWQKLQSQGVYDNPSLDDRARKVRGRYLADVDLPAFDVRFSRRQKKRWGSCSFDGHRGMIRISAQLIGHPVWLIDHLLLHEIAHLRHANHGPEFQALLARDPQRDRAKGYLEALELIDRNGDSVAALADSPAESERGAADDNAPPTLFDVSPPDRL